jgi:hypothetical protein
LGGLSNLHTLWLYSNQLTENIPSELGSLSNLRYLWLYSNNLDGNIPSELGSLSNLWELRLQNNQLEGNIPSQLGSLTNLKRLLLDSNHLTGNIPTELGSLGNLQYLWLHKNKLRGVIPTSLTALTGLTNTQIGYNALYTDDGTLETFLNAKDPDWADTQTIAPEGVTAFSLSSTSIQISWMPVTYVSDAGSYRVLYSTSSGGPYTLFGSTADKTTYQMEVTGLTPETAYYFVVQTRTDPHSYNSNTVDSEYSQEVKASTAASASVSGSVTISIAGHTDLPVTNATVGLEGTAFETTTDKNGDFSFEGVPPDTYTLVITSPDLVPIKQEISLSSGQGLQLTPMMSVFKRGDATGDGKAGLGDAVYILQVTCGERDEE